MSRWLALAGSAALLAAGCQVTIPKDVKFPCGSDKDCGGGGFRCIEGWCCNPDVATCETDPGDAGSGDAGAACPTGYTACGGGCVDVQQSPAHCGACNQTCAATEACVAGTCAALSSGNPFLNPLAPASATVGAPVSLSLSGERFGAGAVVRFSGPVLSVERTLTVADAQHGSVDVDLSAVLPGTVEVRVVNPGRLVSNARLLTLEGQVSATPTLVSVSPALVPVGYSGPLTVNGSALDITSQVQLSGGDLTAPLPFSTVYVSTSQLYVQAFDVSALDGGAYDLAVTHAAGTTNSVTLTVSGAVPVITGIDPARAPKGTTVTFAVDGGSFDSTSQVVLIAPGGTASSVTTTLVSGTQLTAGPVDLTSAALGNYGVLVRNNGAFDSNTVGFVVESNDPTLVSVNPAGARQDQTVDLTLSGARFLPGAEVSISSASLPQQALTTTWVDANTVRVLGLDLSAYAIGGYQLRVTNPGSAASASVVLTVTEGTPTLTTVSPTSASVGGTQPVVVTLTGTYFYPSSVVVVSGGTLVNSPLPTTYVSSTSLTVSQDVSGQPTGAYTLKVLNPASPSPLSSNSVPFTLAP